MKTRFTVAFAAVLVMLCASATANAATLYLDDAGTDAGACTSSGSPCLSFDYAYHQASPGDHVQVNTGTYGDQLFTTKSGANVANVVFQATGGTVQVGHLQIGDDPVHGLGGPLQEVHDITIEGPIDVVDPGSLEPMIEFVHATDIVLDGFAIDANWDNRRAITFYGNNQDLTIRNSDVCCNEDAPLMESVVPWHGEYTTGKDWSANEDITFEYSKIHSIRRTSGSVHNECFLAAAVPGLTLRSTHWYGCNVMNINIGAFGDSAAYDQTDFHWVNNIFEAPTDTNETVGDKIGLPFFQGCNTPDYENKTGWVVEYNIFETGWYDCYPFGGGDDGLLLRGNIGVLSYCWNPVLYPNIHVTYEHNIWTHDDGNCGADDQEVSGIFSSANFADIAAHDWRPVTGAAQIDQGDPSSYPADDFAGTTRFTGAAPDAGPYEYRSPVAKWSFDETSGTSAADSSGNALTGTLSAGAAFTNTGKYGGAVTFDGVDDYVNVADDDLLDLNTFTLEAWVYPTSLASNWRTVVFKEDANVGRQAYSLYAANASAFPTVEVGNPAGSGVITKAGSATISTNTWTHVAATYDGSAVKVYKDGSLIGTQALTGTLTTSPHPLKIGGNAIYWNEWFEGKIDEVTIYDRALSAAEIAADM